MVLQEGIEGVNVFGKTEDGFSICAFTTWRFPPKFVSNLGIGSGILLFML